MTIEKMMVDAVMIWFAADIVLYRGFLFYFFYFIIIQLFIILLPSWKAPKCSPKRCKLMQNLNHGQTVLFILPTYNHNNNNNNNLGLYSAFQETQGNFNQHQKTGECCRNLYLYNNMSIKQTTTKQ